MKPGSKRAKFNEKILLENNSAAAYSGMERRGSGSGIHILAWNNGDSVPGSGSEIQDPVRDTYFGMER